MRRIAKQRRFLSIFALTIAAALLSLVPAYAAAHKESVIVKVNDASLINQIARKFNWRVQKTIIRGTSAIFLLEDVSEGQVKQLLKNEPGIVWVEQNKFVPLDGG